MARKKKSKFIGTVTRSFTKKEVVYKVGSIYDAIDKASYDYLIKNKYIS